MKDLVYCLLDVNIFMQSNAVEKGLFNHAIEAIDYYWLIQPPTPIELVFLWLAQLSPLVDLSIDPDHIESKNLGNNYGKINYNMSDEVDNEKLMTEE